MKTISVSTGCFHNILPPEDIANTIKENGFNCTLMVGKYTPQIKKATVIHQDFKYLEKPFEERIRHYTDLLSLAKRLDAKFVVLHLENFETPEEMMKEVSYLDEMQNEIKICLENGHGRGSLYYEQFSTLFKNDFKNIGFCLDMMHALLNDIRFLTFRPWYKKYLLTAHLSDLNDLGPHAPLVSGKRNKDFIKWIKDVTEDITIEYKSRAWSKPVNKEGILNFLKKDIALISEF